MLDTPSSHASLSFSPEYEKPSAPYSTYRIGGNMETAWFPTTLDEAVELLTYLSPLLKSGETTLNVLGWGSNTLIASAGIAGHTLITRKLADMKALGDGRFLIEAGVHLAKVAHTVLEAGFQWGEYMIGIPGTMGGAAVMNAGAMGQDTARIVERVFVFDLQKGNADWVEASDLAYDYRYSAVDPQSQVVLATECRFQAGDVSESKALMERNIAFRKAHHPIEPNGGSVFRNPTMPPQGGDVVLSAGKLLEDLGAKGTWKVGGAEVSALHANFIVNTNHASSTDVLTLMRQMQVAVWDAYKLRIYPENRFIGLATEAEKRLWHALKEGDPHHAPRSNESL
ncbi:MAG: UDP-N-acetylmuramate dehydrogenase [Vampirovibrionales bacterium]|jgi:UDP-N-acetylmuramate dehydrogenase